MASRQTKGFANAAELLSHFGDHGNDFAATSVKDYEELADHFLSKPRTLDIHECPRKHGDRVRFDKVTNEYGVIGSNGIIRTYFIPKKCSTVPLQVPRIKCHNFASNLDYAIASCSSH